MIHKASEPDKTLGRQKAQTLNVDMCYCKSKSWRASCLESYKADMNYCKCRAVAHKSCLLPTESLAMATKGVLWRVLRAPGCLVGGELSGPWSYARS